MPGFDRTGPAGMGPMTGGARGWCNPTNPMAADYGPYRAPYPGPVRPAYGGYPPAYGLGRPRWGVGRDRHRAHVPPGARVEAQRHPVMGEPGQEDHQLSHRRSRHRDGH